MVRKEKGWSLQRPDWDRIPKPILLKDSWSRIQFGQKSNKSVPESPGVYLIAASHPDRRRALKSHRTDLFGLLYTALYVGETGDLRDRFAQHSSNRASQVITDIKQCFQNRLDFWYLVTETKGQARDLEPILQLALGPSGRRESLKGTLKDEQPAF
jgi:hypothetical protein